MRIPMKQSVHTQRLIRWKWFIVAGAVVPTLIGLGLIRRWISRGMDGGWQPC